MFIMYLIIFAHLFSHDTLQEGVIDVNGTKITLTGIPQIDYVWDPNLPRELNG